MEDIDEWHARAGALAFWHPAFKFLSLDCWLPFWENMGLPAGPDDQLFIRDVARKAWQTLHGADITCYDGDYDPDKTAAARDGFLRSLSQNYSQDFAHDISIWIERHCDSRGLGARLDPSWFGALCDLYHAEQGPDKLTASRLLALKDAIHKNLMDPYERIYLETREVNTLSEWDRRLRRTQFDPKYPDRDEVPCRSLVCLVTQSRHLLRLWHYFIETCSDNEISELVAWYRGRETLSLQRWPELDRPPLLD